MQTNKRWLYLFICILSILPICCYAQVKRAMNIGFPVKVQMDDEYKKIIDVLEKYFSSVNYSKSQDSCWVQSDFKNSYFPGFKLVTTQRSDYFNDDHYYKPTLLSIVQLDSCDLAYIAFSHQENNELANVSSIIKVLITEVNGKKKIGNGFNFNLKKYKWKHNKVGVIDYYNAPQLSINYQQADSMNNFNELIAERMQTKLIRFSYLVSDNFEQLQQIKGILYEATSFVGAQAETYSKRIYVSTGTFYYPHELVHLYTYQLFKYGYFHSLFYEGLATYWGGSRGRSLQKHLEDISRYTKANSSISLEDINNYKTIWVNGYTDTFYAIGGLICKLAYEKQGFKGLETLFNAGTTNANAYEAIEKVLGVKKADLNVFLRKELQKY